MRHFERRLDDPVAALPATVQQRHVALLHLAFPELRVQLSQRGPAFGHEQATAGFPVQTVHQFEPRLVTAQLPQQLDDPETQTTAAMDSQSGRFVEDEHIAILEQYPRLEPLGPGFLAYPAPGGDPSGPAECAPDRHRATGGPAWPCLC